MSDSLRAQILDSDKKRYSYLLNLYQLSGANEHKWPQHKQICDLTEVSVEEGFTILQYLKGEGLAKPMTMGREHSSISITHYGIVEIEASIRQPQAATEHFSTQVINMIQNFHGTVNGVQNIENPAGDVHQNISTANYGNAAIFEQMRQDVIKLAPIEREKAEALIQELEEETFSENPNPNKIRVTSETLLNLGSGIFGQLVATFLQGQLGIGG